MPAFRLANWEQIGRIGKIARISLWTNTKRIEEEPKEMKKKAKLIPPYGRNGENDQFNPSRGSSRVHSDILCVSPQKRPPPSIPLARLPLNNHLGVPRPSSNRSLRQGYAMTHRVQPSPKWGVFSRSDNRGARLIRERSWRKQARETGSVAAPRFS